MVRQQNLFGPFRVFLPRKHKCTSFQQLLLKFIAGEQCRRIPWQELIAKSRYLTGFGPMDVHPNNWHTLCSNVSRPLHGQTIHNEEGILFRVLIGSFDPSAGTTGKKTWRAVAVVSHPHDAIPLQGTWYWQASDLLAMTVAVKVNLAD
jgi:hypothetical protein